MLTWAMKKIFGTSHERAIRRMRPKVEAINRLEPELKKLSDDRLGLVLITLFNNRQIRTKSEGGVRLYFASSSSRVIPISRRPTGSPRA